MSCWVTSDTGLHLLSLGLSVCEMAFRQRSHGPEDPGQLRGGWDFMGLRHGYRHWGGVGAGEAAEQTEKVRKA